MEMCCSLVWPGMEDGILGRRRSSSVLQVCKWRHRVCAHVAFCQLKGNLDLLTAIKWRDQVRAWGPGDKSFRCIVEILASSWSTKEAAVCQTFADRKAHKGCLLHRWGGGCDHAAQISQTGASFHPGLDLALLLPYSSLLAPLGQVVSCILMNGRLLN